MIHSALDPTQLYLNKTHKRNFHYLPKLYINNVLYFLFQTINSPIGFFSSTG